MRRATYYAAPMRTRLGILVLLVAGFANVGAAADWVVAANGKCVRQWSPSDIGRGPVAMLNGITMPVRQMIGGGQAGVEDQAARPAAERAVRVPALALIGFGTGTAEMLWLFCAGTADFVTGGYFQLVPDDVTELSFAPMTPRFLEPIKQRPTTDHCGRPL
jgi:hypothetical protein